MTNTILLILFTLFQTTLLAQDFSRPYLNELLMLHDDELLCLSQVNGLKNVTELKMLLSLHDAFKNTQDSLIHKISHTALNKKSKNIGLHLISLTSNDTTGDTYKFTKLVNNKNVLDIDKKISLTFLYQLERNYCKNLISLKKIETGTKDLCNTFFDLVTPIKDSLNRNRNEKIDKNIMQLLQLSRNDTLVEIGVGEGRSLELLSVYADNLNIFVNEIDPAKVSLLQSKVILLDHFDKKNIRYTVYSGSEQFTNLPYHTYPKIIIHNAFHHFSHPSEMLCDIKARMNKNSRLFISDAFKDEAVNPACKDHFTRNEFMNYFFKNGFLLASEKPMLFHNFRFCEFYIP